MRSCELIDDKKYPARVITITPDSATGQEGSHATAHDYDALDKPVTMDT